jgi:AcrR family transcriptional regulator
MARRKNIPLEQRRDDVLAAARRVFMEQGFGGASMRAIATAAGVNEAMLYRISPSKKELFEEAVAGPLEEAVSRTVEQSLMAARAAPGTPEMRALTRQYVKDMLNAMQEIAPLLNAALLTDRESGAHFYEKRIEPSIRRMVKVVESNLGFWPHREFDVDFLIRAIFGMCWYTAVDERFRAQATRDADHQAAQIVQLIFDGLLDKTPQTVRPPK